MVVPPPNAGPQAAPKLIGHLDLNPEKRQERYIVIGGVILGVLITGVLVSALFFRDTWERDTRPQLETMLNDAGRFASEGAKSRAINAYEKLFAAIGQREIQDPEFRKTVEVARQRMERLKVEIAARQQQEEEARRLEAAKTAASQPLVSAPASEQQASGGSGRVNHSLVETCKAAWQREGWRHKSRAEQAKAMMLMQAIVEADCPNPADREATLDYIQRDIDSW